MATFNDLTPEQMEKARACKTSEDLVELAEGLLEGNGALRLRGKACGGL